MCVFSEWERWGFWNITHFQEYFRMKYWETSACFIQGNWRCLLQKTWRKRHGMLLIVDVRGNQCVPCLWHGLEVLTYSQIIPANLSQGWDGPCLRWASSRNHLRTNCLGIWRALVCVLMCSVSPGHTWHCAAVQCDLRQLQGMEVFPNQVPSKLWIVTLMKPPYNLHSLALDFTIAECLVSWKYCAVLWRKFSLSNV